MSPVITRWQILHNCKFFSRFRHFAEIAFVHIFNDISLARYDVFRYAQNDVAPLRSAMMRCLPQNVAKPRIIRRSRHHWRSQHHLPKANIIQKSLICLVDKLGFFVGAGNRNLTLPRTCRALFAIVFRLSKQVLGKRSAFSVHALAPVAVPKKHPLGAFLVRATGIEPARLPIGS